MLSRRGPGVPPPAKKHAVPRYADGFLSRDERVPERPYSRTSKSDVTNGECDVHPLEHLCTPCAKTLRPPPRATCMPIKSLAGGAS